MERRPGEAESFNFAFPALVALVSFLWFVLRVGTAFEFPAIDMAPFFQRAADPSFAPHDFFTNASSEANPRHIFGYPLLLLVKLFGADWYTVLFVLKVAVTVCLPVFFYLALLTMTRRYEHGRARGLDVLLAAVVCAAVYWRINLLASIAWWPPLFIQATSASVATILGLAAIVQISREGDRRRRPGVLLFACATILHPAMGLFVIAFWMVGSIAHLRYRDAARVLVLGWAVPAAALALIYRPAAPLSAAEFVQIYVVLAHPFHYDVRALGTFTPYPWQWTFAALTALFLIPAVYAASKRMKDLALLATLALVAYTGSLVLQYAGTTLVPSKIVAQIGPVRFTSFGYWLAGAAWALMICRMPRIAAFTRALSARVPVVGRNAFAVWLVVLIVAGSVRVDAPIERVKQADSELYAFVEGTPSDSVFAVTPGEVWKFLLFAGKRAVFNGAWFPFREDRMIEYRVRQELMHGVPAQAGYPRLLGIEDLIRDFKGLTSADFARIAAARRLDYVIVEPDQMPAFPGEQPVFRTARYAIYRVGGE